MFMVIKSQGFHKSLNDLAVDGTLNTTNQPKSRNILLTPLNYPQRDCNPVLVSTCIPSKCRY